MHGEASLHASPAHPKKSVLIAECPPERGERAENTSKQASQVRPTAGNITGKAASALYASSLHAFIFRLWFSLFLQGGSTMASRRPSAVSESK